MPCAEDCVLGIVVDSRSDVSASLLLFELNVFVQLRNNWLLLSLIDFLGWFDRYPCLMSLRKPMRIFLITLLITIL